MRSFRQHFIPQLSGHLFIFPGVAALWMMALLLLPAFLPGQTVFKAQLTGRSEALPVVSRASGEIAAVLDGDMLQVSGSFTGLEGAYDPTVAGGAHIHLGYAGENGGIELGLTPVLSVDLRSGAFESTSNTFALTSGQMEALMNRQLYVNIHTTAYAGGELRGQLLPQADAYYYINLLGSNEVPSVFSRGHGALALELNGSSLTVSGAFSGLEGDFNANIAGGAHLHLALPGQNGGIAIGLDATVDAGLRSGTFEAADNTFTLTSEQLDALGGRRLYANIHTTAYASGELRGQVASAAANTVFRAHLSGANETPAVTSAATGVVQAEVIGDSILLSGSFSGLESSVNTNIAGGAHLHTALAGSNGGIAIPLNLSLDASELGGLFPAASNGFPLNEGQVEAAFDRRLYINIHTLGNGSGELRGQLLPEAQLVLTGVLSGAFEVPALASRATGAIKAELMGNRLSVSGSVNGLGSAINTAIAGGAHLHLGMAGKNGPIAFQLVPDISLDMTDADFSAFLNTFELSGEQVEALANREYYINIHTLDNGSGEVRGQLLREANYYMYASLSGTSEVPAVNTGATGAVAFEVTGEQAIATGGFSGLESPFDPNVAGGAHIHNALAGSNAGISQPLNATLEAGNLSGAFLAAGNTFPVDDALAAVLRSRGLYVNIHTEGNQSGELRGQVLPLATAYFTATLAGLNEVQPAATPANGGLKLELRGSELTVSGAFSGLTGDFDASIAGGAHLHLGSAGENGGVDLLLAADVAADLKSGAFPAADNTFSLSEEQITSLFAEGYYANIHTTAYPRGELRGQALPEANFFPSATAAITLPPDGAGLTLEGGSNTVFSAQWTPATDGNQLAYIWQLSTDADFNNVVFQQNVGAALAFVSDFGTVDGLLASLGVDVGATATVYHRVLASDGSVATAGGTASVNITRGVVLEDNFRATLSGHNEVLPIATTATGNISASLMGNQLVVSGSFENLSSPLATDIMGGAHLHVGYAGQNGPIVFPLTAQLSDDRLSGTFDVAENTFTLNEEQIGLLRGRRMYVNIHSGNFRSGELRGQLLPLSDDVYTMSLLGSNEAPAVVSTGQGALNLEVSGDQLVVTGAFSSLSGDFDANIAGGAHLHAGLAGQNGGIQIPLVADVEAGLKSGVFTAENNTFDLTEELRAALQNRSLYANIHTTLYPSGELRGQTVGEPQMVFRAGLSGANEVPAVTSFAGGAVIAELYNDSILVVSGSFAGLESELATNIGGGAHIHLSFPGQNSGVLFPLTANTAVDGQSGVFLPEDNTFVLTDRALTLSFLGRGMYINVHSLNHPSGEIRGQLLLESQTVLNGVLSGIFEVPEVATSAAGNIQAELSGNRLTLTGTFAGLSSPIATNINGGAHIHSGFAGSTGGIAFPLDLIIDSDMLGAGIFSAFNTFELTPEQAQQARARACYVNIRTEDNPSGELRAQLVNEAAAYFVAPLSGASEVTALRAEASGMVILEANNGRAVGTGSVINLSSPVAVDIAGGAHIHRGYAGQNGPVIQLLGLNPDNGIFTAGANRFPFTEGWGDSLRLRSYYVNVHTTDNPSGEVRGQLLPLATTYFTASLSGQNEVQPAATDGRGGLKLELTGNRLTLTGAFSNLAGDFDANVAGGSHLHIGAPGENGGLDITLAPTLAADLKSGIYTAEDNAIELTGEQVATLRAGNNYFNLHTTEFAGGELRSQILPEINFFPSDEAAITVPADGAAITIAGNPDTPFSPQWDMASDRDQLAYIWQLSATDDFSALLVNQNVGANQVFETTFGVVDVLLESAGVGLNESITLYHRALASDGSVATPGASASVTLTRGVVTGTGIVDRENLQMKAFPTVTRERVNVRLQSSQPYDGQLLLRNANGQALDIRPVQLAIGTTDEQIDVRQLPAGSYYLQLVIDGQLIGTQPVIVE